MAKRKPGRPKSGGTKPRYAVLVPIEYREKLSRMSDGQNRSVGAIVARAIDAIDLTPDQRRAVADWAWANGGNQVIAEIARKLGIDGPA